MDKNLPPPGAPDPHDPSRHDPDLSGTSLDFTPVPMARARADGWTPLAQRRFIFALSVMGSVGPAARAAGMGRGSAYRLRERAELLGGEALRFVAAWDMAIGLGRSQQYGAAMDAAVNGVTTVRVLRGGSVTLTGGPDMRLLRAALREPPPPPPRRGSCAPHSRGAPRSGGRGDVR